MTTMTERQKAPSEMTSEVMNHYESPWPPINIEDNETMLHKVQESRSCEVELITASYSGDEAKVVSLLKEGSNPNECDKNNYNTALLAATLQSHTGILHHLLDYGAQLKPNDEVLSPVLLAVITGRSRVVPILVELGKENLYTKDEHGRTAIVLAALQGDRKMVECLHKLGADINYHNGTGNSVLMAGVQGGSLKVVEYLVEKGSLVDHAADTGLTSVICSACQPDTEVLEYLLKHTKRINGSDSSGNTALIVSAMSGNEEAVEILLKFSPEVNRVNHAGYTALDYAHKLAGSKMEDVLTREGAKYGCNIIAEERDANSGRHRNAKSVAQDDSFHDKDRSKKDEAKPAVTTSESALCVNVKNGNSKDVELLVKSGADVNAQGELGQTPVILAVINNHLEMLVYLCNQGADVNIKDNSGRTALFYALKFLPILKYLLTCKVSVNVQDLGGKTVLMEACNYGNTEAVGLLLNNEAAVDIRDDLGRTTLMYSCLVSNHASVATVSRLVHCGASVNAADHRGDTALALALQNKNFPVAKTLVSLGTDIQCNAIIEAFHQGHVTVLDFILCNQQKVGLATMKTALQYFFANLQMDMLNALVGTARLKLLQLSSNASFFKECVKLALFLVETWENYASNLTEDIANVLLLVIDKVFDRNGFGSQLLHSLADEGMYGCVKMLNDKRSKGTSVQRDTDICYVIDEGELDVDVTEPSSTHEVEILKKVLSEKDALVQDQQKELVKILQNNREMKKCAAANMEKLHLLEANMQLLARKASAADSQRSVGPWQSKRDDGKASPKRNDTAQKTSAILRTRKQPDEEVEVIKTPGYKQAERDQNQLRSTTTPDTSSTDSHTDEPSYSSPNSLLLLTYTTPHSIRSDQRLIATCWITHKPHPKLYLFKLHQSISQYTIDGGREVSNACAIIAMLFAYEYLKSPTPMKEIPVISDIPEPVFEQIEKAIREGNELHKLNYEGKPTYMGPEEVRLMVSHLDVTLVTEVDVDTREPHTIVPHVMALKPNQVILFIKNYRVVSLFPCNDNCWLMLFDSHLHPIYELGITRKFGSFLYYCKKEEAVIRQLFKAYDEMVDPTPFYGKFALFEVKL